jgi:hypothetical protein
MDHMDSICLPHLSLRAVVRIIRMEEELHRNCSLVWILALMRTSQACHLQEDHMHLIQSIGGSVTHASEGL